MKKQVLFGHIFEFVTSHGLFAVKSAFVWLVLLLIAHSRFPEYMPIIAIVGVLSVIADVVIFTVQMVVITDLIQKTRILAMALKPDPNMLADLMKNLVDALPNTDPEIESLDKKEGEE